MELASGIITQSLRPSLLCALWLTCKMREQTRVRGKIPKAKRIQVMSNAFVVLFLAVEEMQFFSLGKADLWMTAESRWRGVREVVKKEGEERFCCE